MVLGGVDDGGFGDVRGRRALGKGLYNVGWEKLKSFFALRSSLSNQNSKTVQQYEYWRDLCMDDRRYDVSTAEASST